ncbi:hypothetical protein M378DRAFT_76275 [Amanita muscaria Koide BX008]|uniref:Uncharacterized protein n=1 Tax=Amanita muscaria (strain Koide BX008) TaxID=946122 RepID=A0A0C2X9A4_AMAMK|nr:hypothetical protein M378DRAFT_76275 [Amanita muscaria Koide BX008]
MTFRFRTFRQLLSGLIIVMSSTCVGLSLYLLQAITPSAIAWLVIAVHSVSALRALFSATRKPLLKETQTVASESIWLFVLFPFHLILTLLIITGPFTPAAQHSSYTPLALQVFVLVDAIVHICYAVGVILVAMLTARAFDSDVWIRDLDASPSPFPIPVLFASYFPCCFSLPPSEYDRGETPVMSSVPCFARCNCATKSSIADTSQPSTGTLLGPRSGLLSSFKSSSSLSHTLVRIPNAAERRSSITVSFEV